MALETVVIKIKGDSKELDATIDKIQKVGIVDKKNAESFKKTSKSMGAGFDGLKKKAMALGATMLGAFAIQQVVSSAINTLKNFEKELSTLQSITGSTAKEMEFFQQAAKDVGLATKTSATEVVKAFTMIGSAQPELLKNSKALAEVTKQALILSKAAGIDASSAAVALTSAMNQFGVSAKDAAKFTDIFATSQQKGSSFIADTSEALINAGAAASAAGLTFETTNAAIQALAKGAIVGARAGTALRGVLSKLSSQSDDSINPSMVGLGDTITELAKRNLTLKDATKLVGEEGATGLLTLIKQKDIYFELDGALNDVGNAQRQMALNTDNLDGALIDLNNAWETFILSIEKGDGIIGKTLRGMVDGATHLISYMTATDKVTKSTQNLFKENTKSITQAIALKNEYEKLNAKTNKTEEETRKLHDITGQLSDMFGTSVVNIDKETGALSLNTTELVKQIAIRQALQSEQARELLADKLRFETQIERIKINKEWLDQLKKSKDVSVTVLSVLNDEAGALGLTTMQTGELTHQITKLSDAEQLLVERIRKAQAGLASEGIIKQELINVNETLLESGIDLEAIASQQIKTNTNLATSVSAVSEADKKAAKKKADEDKKLRQQIQQSQIKSIEDERLRAKRQAVFDSETKIKNAKGDAELIAKLVIAERERLGKELADIDKKFADESLEFWTNEAKKRAEVDDAAAELKKENDKARRDETIAAVIAAQQQMFTIIAQFNESKLIALDNEEKKALEALEAQGLGEEELAKKKNAIQEDIAKQRADILRKQFIADKAAALVQIAIDTSLGIMKTIGQTGFLGTPLAVIIGALGAAQAAIVASQPIPEFHEGKKPELKDGEVFAKILKSESVIPPEQSKKYKGAIDSMIDKKFENYVFQEYMLPMMKSMSKKDVTPYNDVHLWNNQKKQIRLMQESNGLTKLMIKTLDHTNHRRTWNG